MIESNQPVFHCSYCKRYYLHKHHAAKHEKGCKNNPNNKHKCFDFCKHLNKEKISNGIDDYTPCYTRFTCSCTKINMYSFLAEKKGLLKLHRETFEEDQAVRMPLVCDKYEPMPFDTSSGTYIQ